MELNELLDNFCRVSKDLKFEVAILYSKSPDCVVPIHRFPLWSGLIDVIFPIISFSPMGRLFKLRMELSLVLIYETVPSLSPSQSVPLLSIVAADIVPFPGRWYMESTAVK